MRWAPRPAARPLAEADLLDAADACRNGHHVDAAVFLARLADPDLDADAAADLSIGQRDRLLLDLRAATFGRRLDLAAECPACGEGLEVGLTTDALAIDPPDPARVDTLSHITVDGTGYRLRPVSSRDLAAVARVADPAQARRVLVRRCLERLPPDTGGPAEPPPVHLPEAAAQAVAERLAELDPQADPFVDLTCPACGHRWEAPVDIGMVLARDIDLAAGRLLIDIHDLARGYHWTEPEILALPPHRRAGYLELLRS